MIFGYIALVCLVVGIFESWVYYDHHFEEDLYILIIAFASAVFLTIVQFTGG